MNGTNQVRELVRKGDWATSLDLKSAFHLLIAYHPHRPYLAFEVMNKIYQYRAIPFGTQHSPIFLAQALALLLTKIMQESDIRIVNYVDDLLLSHQDKAKLKQQTLAIMQILERFGWTIAMDKCELEPKQQIDFLGWSWNIEKMYIKMIEERRRDLFKQIVQFIKIAQQQITIKIKYLAALIGRLNFLKTQIREASLCMQLMNAAKTKAVREMEQTGMIILPKEVLQELHWWRTKIKENRQTSLETKIPQAQMVSDASTKGWGTTLELQTGDTLVQHGQWRKQQKLQISNRKQMEAIFQGPYRYATIFKELQLKTILIRSDSSTAVQDLAKQRAGKTLQAGVKKIIKLFQQLEIEIVTQHIPGIVNRITDALSRMNTKGEYMINIIAFMIHCQIWKVALTLDLFTTKDNKVTDWYVTLNEEEEAETQWIDAFSKPWQNELFWIHPPISKQARSQIIGDSSNQSQLFQLHGGQVKHGSHLYQTNATDTQFLGRHLRYRVRAGRCDKRKTYFHQEKQPHSSWIKSRSSQKNTK
ncbi:MAG: putative Transposon Ty3-I Gag-Pol polyprotein [Streblomastix strix]|uniref:Putative Transposon Ty3-I Gag-Pol polyprotein n=1 Tax=Streblomastix strix TaxID=222440 RepID=A0A5J4U2Z9_9EUKA|nr:MAG: putative Transposon Ty3-I Gag-Pol polyprotein [Streblomastix strix]